MKIVGERKIFVSVLEFERITDTSKRGIGFFVKEIGLRGIIIG